MGGDPVEDRELNHLTKRIIGCAIEVHRHLGPGLLESIYESALCIELKLAGLAYERQKPVPVTYKGHALGDHRLDVLVEDTVILELKSVERFDPVFEAQILSYLKMTGKPIGLLINFNTRLLKDGIKRYRI
ncbi:MAG TPA: GxxExxY protein [Chloroflexi bacterium]|nr:GxxExxY protein [Chloroflexota bacterium]